MKYFIDYPKPSEQPPQYLIDLAKVHDSVDDAVPMVWSEGEQQVALTYGELRQL